MAANLAHFLNTTTKIKEIEPEGCVPRVPMEYANVFKDLFTEAMLMRTKFWQQVH